ncbi:hypothetical protein [Pedobacter heparinus]|uniref:hypothetical protein n=1 Tax=Pedobacter heparinus TaxID=984 RepID=UPI002930379F|nr:hypothetical protein [Pedobacter heparinus]
MEPYQINVSGMPLVVFPMNDGTYRVSDGKQSLANLYAEITGLIFRDQVAKPAAVTTG